MEKENNLNDLNAAKKKLQAIEAEWLKFFEEMKNSKDEKINSDIFAALEYLKCCDLFFKNSSIELDQLEKQLQSFSALKEEHKGNDDLESIDGLIHGFKQLKMNLQKRIEDLDNEYSILSETTFGKVHDLVTEYDSNSLIEQSQKIDHAYLKTLKKSLEDYRQSRQEFMSESAKGELKIDDKVHGDYNEENDPVLSQLNAAIADCDSALREEMETE
ncbi:MAG: hypothetical protein H0V82_04660 [Candidatus Protochlamydia sp.]|nr:hypothetical protein [Candidatus Protochlamydia sp.]